MDLRHQRAHVTAAPAVAGAQASHAGLDGLDQVVRDRLDRHQDGDRHAPLAGRPVRSAHGGVGGHAYNNPDQGRIFRLTPDRAVINRLGFNNKGLEAFADRLAARSGKKGIVGANVGANKDSADRIADYLTGIAAFRDLASYITVNISSPNTPGLRDLQGDKELNDLLSAIAAERQAGDPPIFLKVAPDLDAAAPGRIVEAAIKHGIAAIIVSNTTITRPPLMSGHAGEVGGLSGAPLRDLAQQRLRDFHAVAKGAIPLVGVGGIASAEDAWARIRAGASLVQLYSAMVYAGPGLARRITRGLDRLMRRDGFSSIAEAVGTE